MNPDSYPTYPGSASPRSHPYAPSLSSSASSSTSSVFSDAGSQTSNSTAASGTSLENPRPSGAYPDLDLPSITRVSTFPQYRSSACRDSALPALRPEPAGPPQDQLQHSHPRRSSTVHQRPPPQLVRQCDRKVNFVDCLVG
jgi:hypothetical protein